MIQGPSPSVQDDVNPQPSIYEKRETEKQLNSLRRRHHALTAVCLILAAVIGGAIWYEYPVLVAHKADLIKLPRLVQGMDAIADHLRQSDAQIATWSKQRDIDRETMQVQMTRLTRELHTGMVATRKEVSDAADAAYTRIETRINEQIDRIDTRLASLETGRAADQKQIAALKQQLASVRQDLSQQTDKVATLEQQVEQNRTGTASLIGTLRSEQVRGQQEVDTIANQLAADKVSFEAPKGQDHELASGISLRITRTDASRGRFDGWLAQPGQPNIELHHQSVQEPVIFYGLHDGKRRELVFTSIARNSVAGYLLVPKETVRQSNSGE